MNTHLLRTHAASEYGIVTPNIPLSALFANVPERAVIGVPQLLDLMMSNETAWIESGKQRLVPCVAATDVAGIPTCVAVVSVHKPREIDPGRVLKVDFMPMNAQADLTWVAYLHLC